MRTVGDQSWQKKANWHNNVDFLLCPTISRVTAAATTTWTPFSTISNLILLPWSFCLPSSTPDHLESIIPVKAGQSQSQLSHCCTIFLGHLGIEIADRHRNPNINIKEIIWLGNQLPLPQVWWTTWRSRKGVQTQSEKNPSSRISNFPPDQTTSSLNFVSIFALWRHESFYNVFME